jgi:hypothetical protein
LPRVLKQEKQPKDMVNVNRYSVIEGAVQGYKLRESNGRYFESFRIDSEFFEYSDYNKADGFYQTAMRNGPISQNGQFFKVSYYKKNGVNLIVKIEVCDSTWIYMNELKKKSLNSPNR